MTEFLLLVGVAVLVGANGFFVAAEFALVRARDAKLELMEKEGMRGAQLAGLQLERIDEYLSACQLGITMASLGIGFMGEPAIASLLESALGDSLSHDVTLAISLGMAYLITTALHITVGEQVPKIYAITHAEGMARRAARLLEALPRHVQAAHLGAQRRVERDPARNGREPEGRVRGDLLGRRPQDDHRPQRHRGQARPGRGRDAARRLPPARAGGAGR